MFDRMLDHRVIIHRVLSAADPPDELVAVLARNVPKLLGKRPTGEIRLDQLQKAYKDELGSWPIMPPCGLRAALQAGAAQKGSTFKLEAAGKSGWKVMLNQH